MAIHRALSHLGLTEQPLGSNDEPTGTIDGWLRAAGVDPAATAARKPWCASALSAWLELEHPYAGALRLVRSLRRVIIPLAGDAYCYPTNDRGNGHCGLVVGVQDAPHWVLGVEGNLDHGVRCVARSAADLEFGSAFAEGPGLLPIPSGAPFRVTRRYAGAGGTR